MKPHILIATTAYHPFIGGAEIAVAEIVARTQHEFQYSIVTARMDRSLPARETIEGVSIFRVGFGVPLLDKLLLIGAVSWHAITLRPQAVWAIMASYGGAGALLAHLITRIPYGLTLQEGDDLDGVEKRVGVFMPLFRQIFVRARGIHAIAPFLGSWAKRMGATTTPVIIPNGVDTTKFVVDSSERLSIRDALHIPHDAYVALTVSRLVPKNGIADFISAVSITPELHAIIIGDGALRFELEKSAYPYRDRIHFIGSRNQSEIARYAGASDLFCRPAISEGQGIVFLEALAMGLPVVATRVGGIPSMLTDGETALLVEPRSVSELVLAFKTIMTNKTVRNSLITQGRSLVATYEWNVLTPKISAWLRALLH